MTFFQSRLTYLVQHGIRGQRDIISKSAYYKTSVEIVHILPVYSDYIKSPMYTCVLAETTRYAVFLLVNSKSLTRIYQEVTEAACVLWLHV